MSRRTPRPVLTAEQKADAERLRRQLADALAGELDALAEQLASTTDATLFGANEFAVRDLVLRLGAKAVEVAAADRAKKVTTGAAALAPPAPERPSSNAGSPAPSSPCSGRSA